MKYSIAAIVAAISVVNAQLVFNSTTNEFECLGAAADKDFCAGGSLSSNIIIRCSGAKGQPGNCNDNLAGVPPVGVKTAALCYQSSNSTGDAVCSFNGIGYKDDGTTFPLPSSSSTSSSASSTSSSSSSTSILSTYTPPTTYSVSTTSATSTLVTVTGTITVTTCSTSSYATGGSVTAAPTNGTTYTTSLPQPTYASDAGAVALQGGALAGVIALAAALFL